MAQKYVLLIVFFALSSEVAIILKNIQLWPTNTGETKGGRNLPDGATEKRSSPSLSDYTGLLVAELEIYTN